MYPQGGFFMPLPEIMKTFQKILIISGRDYIISGEGKYYLFLRK